MHEVNNSNIVKNDYSNAARNFFKKSSKKAGEKMEDIAGDIFDKNKDESDKKLVLIQIDGLSHDVMEKAIDKEYTPNISSLLESGEYQLNPFSCGLASITLALQSSFFYGRELPGNIWYDKDTNQVLKAEKYETKMREELEKKGKKGLLDGGLSASSPLTGGASQTVASVNEIMTDMEEIGPVKAVMKEIKKESSLLNAEGRTVRNAADDFLGKLKRDKELLDNVDSLKTKEDYQNLVLLALDESVLKNVATTGLKQAIQDGLPVMYTDYFYYDEISHYLGAESQQSMDSLRETDEKIGEVLDEVEKSPDNYEVFIFSDHGQTPSILFSEKYGKKFSKIVEEYAEECSIKQSNGKPEGFKDNIQGALTRASVGIPGVGKKEKKDVIFTDAFSLGNIYFNFTDDQAEIKDIEKRYPGITDKLVQHPGIGLVCGRKKNKFFIKGKEGQITVGPLGYKKVEGKNPLRQYAETEKEMDIRARQIVDYLKVDNTGDLVVLGSYDKEKDEVIDLNERFTFSSVHGGLGGNQMEPFLISRKDLKIKTENITEGKHLHNIFRNQMK
jgi:hypothetical protein